MKKVHAILFTDLLLLTTRVSATKFKMIAPAIQTNQIVIKRLHESENSFLVLQVNEYSLVEQMYLLSTVQCEKWIENLNHAKVNIIIFLLSLLSYYII